MNYQSEQEYNCKDIITAKLKNRKIELKYSQNIGIGKMLENESYKNN